MEIEEYLCEIANGKIEALQLLYEELKTSIFALILAIVRNRTLAEDLLQETFIRIYTKAYQYKPNTNAKAWVITIARNLSYESLRNNKIVDLDIEEVACEDFRDISLLVTNNEDHVINKLELTRALLNLEKTEREIVVMHVVAGLKHSEIGKALCIPDGTVRWKYRMALQKLFKQIGGNSYAE
jgi:RNA polymerase sigma-70 factor (ECF subfamily)